MEITEQICDVRPTEEVVSAFEQAIGGILPLTYRSFLLLHNGGRPHPSIFTFHTRGGRSEEGSVHFFFGLHDGRIGNLQANYIRYEERVPKGFLPIALDPFGNLILLGTEKWNHGKVYFWDHEREEDLPSLKNISLIAASFEVFTDALSEEVTKG